MAVQLSCFNSSAVGVGAPFNMFLHHSERTCMRNLSFGSICEAGSTDTTTGKKVIHSFFAISKKKREIHF